MERTQVRGQGFCGSNWLEAELVMLVPVVRSSDVVSGCWENERAVVVDNPSDRSGNAEENQCVSNEREAVTARKEKRALTLSWWPVL